MDLHALRVFETVATERSFSRAAKRLLRTQPAVSLTVQRLEHELGERLIDRSGRQLILTEAGQTVLDYARRFESLRRQFHTSLSDLRDHASGRLVVGANESTTLYLLQHIERYRRLFPRVKIEVRRSLSSRIPAEILAGNLDLGVVSYEPGAVGLASNVIYIDALAFVVSPRHRLARRRTVSIRDLGRETFIAHNVVSPYRDLVLRTFERHGVTLLMGVEMPTIEGIRRLVEANEGVAFIPRMCVERELAKRTLREVRVPELQLERKIRLLHPSGRTLSHAARVFLNLVVKPTGS